MLLSFKLHYSCISITRAFSQIYLLIFLHLLGANINTKHAKHVSQPSNFQLLELIMEFLI